MAGGVNNGYNNNGQAMNYGVGGGAPQNQNQYYTGMPQ